MWTQHRIMPTSGPGQQDLGVVRAYDPWEVRVWNLPSSMCMVTSCIRAFFGLSVFFGIVWAPYGLLRMPYRLVNSQLLVRGPVMISKHRTEPVRSHTRAMIGCCRSSAIRHHENPSGARAHRPVSSRIGPIRLSMNLLWSQNRCMAPIRV